MHTAVPAPFPTPLADRSLSFGILSTFPPTSCGIATFSAALAAGLIETGASVDVVRCGEPPRDEDVLVVATLDGPGASDRAAALAALNANDVVIVQHEYGLYDGADGDDVVTVMDSVAVPILVVAHTVLEYPTAHQREVLEQVCERADAIVVMTEAARSRLCDRYGVTESTVTVIPHGAATPSTGTATGSRPAGAPFRLLTWGLLGPGKGIEWAIDSLDELDGVRPLPEYVVAGATHPKVRERHGEAYRSLLLERVAASRSPIAVSFDDTYRDLAALNDLIESADLVVLPYDSRDQVTSGVLVDAVAAGRPVVSTAFPHAVELLASGAGLVVPQRDPVALGRAIRSVLTEPGLASSMAAEARRLAPGLSWSAVARRYVALADRLVASDHPVTS